MRKSILRFGALALMSMMSIGSWAQTGATFQAANKCLYTVKEVCTDADGNQYFTVILKTATTAGDAVWNDTTQTNTGWKGYYSPEIGVTDPIPYVVTEVGQGAFSTVVSSIQIPNHVKVFGQRALNSKTVTAVDFTNVTSIDQSAFEGANFTSGLDHYNFTFNCNPSNRAFYDASFPSYASITLGDATEDVKSFAFGADSLKNDLETVVIKNATGLTEIKDHAFQNRSGIKTFGYFNDNGMHYLPASLSKVGDSAFEGCANIETFRFAINDKYQGKAPRITAVGTYAFKGCNWMDNVTFANVCTSFDAPFSYAAGSFQNCGLTGELDLRESGVTVTKNNYGNNDPRNYTNKPGVPTFAFAGNNITSVLLNDNFEVIQISAFQDNNSLDIPKVLPNKLWMIEESAFNVDATKSQDSLYLPETLRFIEKNAFSNRTIANVYAHPAITGDARKNDIPYLKEQTSLSVSNTYVPASEKFKISGNTEQSLVYWYNNRGWVNNGVKFATKALMSNSLGYNYLYNVNGVTYTVYSDFNTGDNEYGYIRAYAQEFTEGAPVIYGYIGLTDDQFLTDNNPDTDPTVHHDHKLNFCQYQYPIVLKVEALIMGRATYPTATNLAEDVYAISFKPEAAYDDNAGATHADEIATDSKAAYVEIPAYICQENIALVTTEEFNPVIIGEGITTIGSSAFAGTTNLTAITLPSTLITVNEFAFADGIRTAGLKSIELPKNLQFICSGAFNAKSLQTVKVEYTPTNPGAKPIPTYLPANAFASDANGLFIASLVKKSGYDRSSYYNVSNWNKFFDYRAEVKTATDKTLMVGLDQPGLAQIYTEDEDLDGDGYFTKQYVLKDNGELSQVKITELYDGAKVPVKYVRNFKENNVGKVQCWYVPFDYKFVPNSDYKFYYIYNTTQSSWEADAETRIGLKAVPNDKDADGNDLGYATIKANTPYIIVVKKAGEISFYGEALTKTTLSNPDGYKVVVKDVKNEYTFAGVYQRKGGNPTTPWYGISNGGFIKFTESQNGINAFRFYMTALNQPNPYHLVKFVFDDEEEDATGIKDVNAETIANGAMFDLMGRQIAAPAKGQVYIQNGVKKLAK